MAKKIETVLTRGTANTRMRDFYDIYALVETHSPDIDNNILKEAFKNTSQKRDSQILIDNIDLILQEIAHSSEMSALWKNYQRKFDYAENISWADVMFAVERLCRVVV